MPRASNTGGENLVAVDQSDLSGVFILDVEATSRAPMTGVMTEFALVHLTTGKSFYGHLYRNHPHPEVPALPVVERDEEGRLMVSARVEIGGSVFLPGTDTGIPETVILPSGGDPLVAVGEALERWLDGFDAPRKTLVSDNNGFDAMWLNCFTDATLARLLFGHSSRRIGDFYAGTRGSWAAQSKWKALRVTRHTHHPLESSPRLKPGDS